MKPVFFLLLLLLFMKSVLVLQISRVLFVKLPGLVGRAFGFARFPGLEVVSIRLAPAPAEFRASSLGVEIPARYGGPAWSHLLRLLTNGTTFLFTCCLRFEVVSV